MLMSFRTDGLCQDEKDFGKMSKVHEIVKKGKQMEPVYLGEIVVC